MTTGLTPSERVKILRQEFARLDLNHDSTLSRDELFSALDELNEGRQFDRGVAVQLYDRMDQNHDGYVTVEEFVKVFMEAEDILKQKIEKAEIYLQDFQKQKQEALQKLEELKRVEQLNQYGVMVGSVLTVTVVEVQDLPLHSVQEVYVKVACEDNVFQTEVLRYTGRATFDEAFTAEVRTGMEEIQVVVLTYDPRSRDEVLGEVIIPVSRLKDQYRHDELFDLHGINGQPVSGKVHLVLHWIHSRVKYLSDVVRKWDEHIRAQFEDKSDFEKDLQTLYEPFKGLLRLKNKPTQTRQAPVVQKNDFSAIERGPVGGDQRHYGEQKSGASQPVAQVQRAAAFNFSQHDKVWFDYCYYGTLVFLGLAFFVCFGRNVFFDILIGLAFVAYSDNLLKDFGGLKIMLGGLGISAFLDIFWLSIYTSGWSSNSIQGYEGQPHTLTFCLVFSYFLFFAKFGLGFLIFRLDKLTTPANAGGVGAGGKLSII